MKFCVEAAVSTAQGGTAVKFPFFSLRKSTEKKFCRRESPSVGTEANPSSLLIVFIQPSFFFEISFA